MTNNENVVFIGNKNLMSYVLACVTLFNNEAPEITIKARGRAISRAVDVTEVLRNKFLKDVTVENISIGTEIVKTTEGKEINVSTIELILGKEATKKTKTKETKPKEKKN
ncbi:MAG: DNA-binding protein Alba [Candidatus Ranarchaeia archaeon]